MLFVMDSQVENLLQLGSLGCLVTDWLQTVWGESLFCRLRWGLPRGSPLLLFSLVYDSVVFLVKGKCYWQFQRRQRGIESESSLLQIVAFFLPICVGFKCFERWFCLFLELCPSLLLSLWRPHRYSRALWRSGAMLMLN